MAAGYQKDSNAEYVLKKGGNEVPVESCKGWIDPCEYCDKRFNKWLSVDEEIYGKIPDKPGFFMIALKNKNSTEVVSLSYEESNMQKNAIPIMDIIRDKISNKKSKSTKSEMLARWMIIKTGGSNKENGVLCAHWSNNGILPKYMTAWPGMCLLEDNDALMFSKYLQKWCYSKKDPVWRKAKPPPSKTVEEVKKCTLQSCEVCDTYFTPWKNLSYVIDNNNAPEENGLVLLSIVFGKNREVVEIVSAYDNTVTNIKSIVVAFSKKEHFYLKHQKFQNRNARLEVRWMVTKDIESDNACFLYAHWLNADNKPLFNQNLVGEKELDKNKNFVLRTKDRKWMYEIEAFKQAKFSKAKNKRLIYDQLRDEEHIADEEH